MFFPSYFLFFSFEISLMLVVSLLLLQHLLLLLLAVVVIVIVVFLNNGTLVTSKGCLCLWVNLCGLNFCLSTSWRP